MIKVNLGKRGKYSNAHVGTFFPQHPEKYLGTALPIYKSELERLAMAYLDKNPNIISWNYEGISIKYFDKAKNKIRHYYLDFVCIAKAGMVKKTIWLEIKTKQETLPPKNKKNAQDMLTYLTNISKWEAASKLAKSKGYEFHILTEEQLKN